jgi:hypothetical protein
MRKERNTKVKEEIITELKTEKNVRRERLKKEIPKCIK